MQPNKQKRIEKLAKYLDNKDAEVFNYLFSILESVENKQDIADLKEMLASIVIPNHEEKLNEISEKLDKEDEIEVTLNIV